MNLKNFPKRLDSKTSCLRIAVPENLDLALEGLIRKVLREQPKTDDIYSFAADYFETLLKIRDKAGAKFTAAQLCPFHNDEDAHEMIKLAGTFAKPASAKPTRKNDESSPGKAKKPAKTDAKTAKKAKPTDTNKNKKPVKQTTPDLIKKLPEVAKPHVERNAKAEDAQTREKEENEEEFLTSDPIKELVEKELMMEASSGNNKTDGNEKTDAGAENTQEEKPLEKMTADTEDKSEIQETKENKEKDEEKETKDKTEETENEKPPTKEEETAEVSTTITQELKTENEKGAKEENEEADKDMAKTSDEITAEAKKENEEVQKNQEDETVIPELDKTLEKDVGPTDRKDEDNRNATQHKEMNKKIETFPVTESAKRVTDVLPSEKLPEISEDDAEKTQDTTETNAELQQQNIQTPAETSATEIKPSETENKNSKDSQQPIEEQTEANNTTADIKPEETETKGGQQETGQPDTQAVSKPEQETLASIPEHKILETSPVGATPNEKDDTSKEDTENQKTEATPVSNTQPTTDNTETEMKTPEDEVGTEKEQSENISQNEEPKETTAEEPKREHIVTLDEDKTFGEIIKNNEEETTLEDIKPEEVKEVEETTTEAEKLIPVEATKVEENTADDKTQSEEPELGSSEKPPEESSQSHKVEDDKHPETSKSGEDNAESRTSEDEKHTEEKKETTNAEVTEIQETEISQTVELVTPEEQPEVQEILKEDTKTDNQHKEEPKTPPEDSAKKDEQNVNQEEQKPTPEDSAKQVDHEEKPGDELCTVVDTPKDDKITTEKTESQPEAHKPDNVETVEEQELPEAKENVTEAEELCTVVDVQSIPKEASLEKTEDGAENTQNKEAEELCMVVDNPPKDDATKLESETEKAEVKPDLKEETKDESQNPAEDSEKPNETKPDPDNSEEIQTEPTETPVTDTQHIIKVEEAEKQTEPDEIQIKTIQTHYYDTLQVPETVTREYRVHNVVLPAAAGLLGSASFLQQPNGLIPDENMNTAPTAELMESLDISPPAEQTTEEVPPTVPDTPEQEQQKDSISPPLVPPLEGVVETPKTDSDDLLDLMTPTSGYSMNVSEISLVTVSELFLDSEKRYSSLEKEDTLYVTPKSGETTANRQEVEEVIEKTVLPSRIEAVPVPPREAEEIEEEVNLQVAETTKEKEKPEKEEEKPEKEKEEPEKDEEKPEKDGEKPEKDEEKPEKEEEKPENDSTEGSSNGRSVDSDTPFISVEVKTVIETQVLDDDEEERNVERPEVEVKVRATIAVQDEAEMSQPQQDSVEGEKEMSEGKDQEIKEEKPSLELQSRDQDEERKGSCSTGVEGSSSLESDLTASSAATEIKRTDSAKRNFSAGRSLVSAQSLDLGKRNPLLKTRSLSTFRHGVTDFEVWNRIEKELEDAAIKIQSKFRGYKTRKKLQRENAVQITTEESSVSTTPVEGEAEAKDERQQSTGEFHDSIILSEHPR